MAKLDIDIPFLYNNAEFLLKAQMGLLVEIPSFLMGCFCYGENRDVMLTKDGDKELQYLLASLRLCTDKNISLLTISTTTALIDLLLSKNLGVSYGYVMLAIPAIKISQALHIVSTNPDDQDFFRSTLEQAIESKNILTDQMQFDQLDEFEQEILVHDTDVCQMCVEEKRSMTAEERSHFYNTLRYKIRNRHTINLDTVLEASMYIREVHKKDRLKMVRYRDELLPKVDTKRLIKFLAEKEKLRYLQILIVQDKQMKTKEI